MTSTADWTIDVGPEAWPGLDPGASDNGGEIVAAGHAGTDRGDEGELYRAVSQAGVGTGHGVKAQEAS